MENLKSKLNYNPKQVYGYEFADKLSDILNILGYKTESNMGISQMRITSQAPKNVFDRVVSSVISADFGKNKSVMNSFYSFVQDNDDQDAQVVSTKHMFKSIINQLEGIMGILSNPLKYEGEIVCDLIYDKCEGEIKALKSEIKNLEL